MSSGTSIAVAEAAPPFKALSTESRVVLFLSHNRAYSAGSTCVPNLRIRLRAPLLASTPCSIGLTSLSRSVRTADFSFGLLRMPLHFHWRVTERAEALGDLMFL